MRKLFLVSLLLVFVCGLARAQEPAPKPPPAPNFEEIFYGDLRKIESFVFIYAHVKGDAKSGIGLTDSEMTDYVRLRFKNSFAGVPYRETPFSSIKDPAKAGSIWCGVWTVGDNYPVAYHVEIRFGTMEKDRIYTDEVLGYGNSKVAQEKVKQVLDNMITQCAIKYFKLRGEM